MASFPIKAGAQVNAIEALLDAWANGNSGVYVDMVRALEKSGYTVQDDGKLPLGPNKPVAVLRGSSKVSGVPASILATQTHYFDQLALSLDSAAMKILRQVLPSDVLKKISKKEVKWDAGSDSFIPVTNSTNPVVTNAAGDVVLKEKNGYKLVKNPTNGGYWFYTRAGSGYGIRALTDQDAITEFNRMASTAKNSRACNSTNPVVQNAIAWTARNG